MMAVGAFNQVQSSLRWFVDNFSAIADWRATLLRVASFRRAVLTTDVLHDVESRIEFVEGEPGTAASSMISRSPRPTAARCSRSARSRSRRGERVLIVGEPGTGKTLFFRALAGLWPWGERPHRPAEGREDPLHAAHALSAARHAARGAGLPGRASTISRRRDFAAALERVGLERLVGEARHAKRWDSELSDDEQQALAFARVMLHKPRWLLIDEVLDSIDDDTHERVVDDPDQGARQQTGVIHIGRKRGARSSCSRACCIWSRTRRHAHARARKTDARTSRRPSRLARCRESDAIVKATTHVHGAKARPAKDRSSDAASTAPLDAAARRSCRTTRCSNGAAPDLPLLLGGRPSGQRPRPRPPHHRATSRSTTSIGIGGSGFGVMAHHRRGRARLGDPRGGVGAASRACSTC